MNKYSIPDHLLFKIVGDKLSKNREEEFGVDNVKVNVNNLINTDGKRILVQGDVQSGKTRNIVELIRRTTENEGYFIIFLTGLKNNLKSQNYKRFIEDFKRINDELDLDETDSDKYTVGSKESGKDSDLITINDLTSNGNTFITTELKKPDRLNIIYDLVKHLECKVLLIDDEGDEASLTDNTGGAINKIINLDNVQYFSITATPFKNLYENEEFYDEFIKLIPGKGYKGIKEFWNNYKIIDPNNYTDLIVAPIVEWAKRIIKFGIEDSQILFNVNLRKNYHIDIQSKIEEFFSEGLEKEKNKKWFIENGVYDFLSNFDTENIFVSNSDEDPETIKFHEKEMKTGHYIIIGGGNLSRGVTYDNLLVEVMVNSPDNNCSPGTLLQRARWFGYKKNHERIAVFINEPILESLKELDDLNDMTKEYELNGDYRDIFDRKKYRRLKI